MTGPARVAVFASGGGTNLQALLKRFNQERAAPARIELVVANRAGIGALDRAEEARVATVVIEPAALGREVAAERTLSELARWKIDLIALAGYLQRIPEEVVEAFRGRIVNIHPALLPAFGGRGMFGPRVHAAVLASGARVSGATVHLVDEDYDRGRILAQWPVPVLPGDSPERLAARVLRVEHLLYPDAIESLVNGSFDLPHPGELSFDIIEADAPMAASILRLNR